MPSPPHQKEGLRGAPRRNAKCKTKHLGSKLIKQKSCQLPPPNSSLNFSRPFQPRLGAHPLSLTHPAGRPPRRPRPAPLPQPLSAQLAAAPQPTFPCPTPKRGCVGAHPPLREGTGVWNCQDLVWGGHFNTAFHRRGGGGRSRPSSPPACPAGPARSLP